MKRLRPDHGRRYFSCAPWVSIGLRPLKFPTCSRISINFLVGACGRFGGWAKVPRVDQVGGQVEIIAFLTPHHQSNVHFSCQVGHPERPFPGKVS